MKKFVSLLGLFLICNFSFAQNQWFTCYSDSTKLIKDANEIIKQFETKVKQLNPELRIKKNSAIKNTKPYLIFIRDSTVNLPFWTEVIPPQKKFFAEVAGGETDGKIVFGLFFNGFYLAHELSHSLYASVGKKFDNAYDSEFEANKIAISYWKSVEKNDNLERCYRYTKKMLKILKNPVPENEDYKKYITENYSKLASDPYKYGYIQFSQFVEIYENKSLPDFDTLIKNVVDKK